MRTRLTITAGAATLLGSVGLHPLFNGWTWLWPGFGAIVVVCATGTLTRRFRLSAILSPAAAPAALILYVTAVFASAQAFLWVVPTPASIARLADLAAAGWATANRYTAPVPLNDGVVLLAVLGVGLVAATVDLLAVRLRRAAPAGLPLLAMYSVPAAVRQDGVSVIGFLLGAAGFLALLLADAREQVVGWGRHVRTARWSEDASREHPDSGAMVGTGLRVGLAAVAIAVLLPLVVPGITPKGLLGLGGGGDRATGSGTVRKPDPMVSLRRELQRPDDSVVLTYRTDDPETPDYLRLWALDLFDGGHWTYSSFNGTSKDRIAGRDLPPAPGLGGGTPVRTVNTKIKMDRQAKDFEFLPLPYAPARVKIKGDWRVHPASLMVYSLNDVADGREYTVTSTRPEPTAAQLQAAGAAPAEIRNRYLGMSPDLQAVVQALARKHTRGASTAYQQAMALQKWFTSSAFAYSLAAPPPDDAGDLVHFLTRSRVGYCQQFAAAMAVLARSLGIPARVAAGYTSGTRGQDGTWVVRSRDAHAWPELYFDGVGWVRFEPTPGTEARAGQGTATTPLYAEAATRDTRPGEAADPTPSPASSSARPGGGTTPGTTRGDRRQDDGDPLSGVPERGTGPDVPVGWISGILLVLVALAVPMGLRLTARRRRWSRTRLGTDPVPKGRTTPRPSLLRRAGTAADPAEAAHAAWSEMRADAIDHGLPWRPGDSPRAAALRLAEHLGLADTAAAALHRIARAEERARYAPVPSPAHTLRADVELMRNVIAASVDRRARLRARFVPPTALSTLRGVGGRSLELFDGLVARASRMIRRRSDAGPRR